MHIICLYAILNKNKKENTMAMKSVLFDLDGTLTDSGEGIINCAALALEHFGLPVPSREEMRVFVGPPLHDTLVKFGVPEDLLGGLLFLLSKEAAGFITGIVLPIDGGFNAYCGV